MRLYAICSIAITVAIPPAGASIYNHKRRRISQTPEPETSVDDERKQNGTNTSIDIPPLRELLETPPLSRPRTEVGKTQLAEISQSFSSVLNGHEIDTANLLAACRKFARATRRTGNKSVARDLESNIRKVVAFYDSAPPRVRKNVSSMLQFERETGIHGRGGFLRDPSAAVGFLWIRRAIAFQSDWYTRVLEHPGKSPRGAALEAYENTLEPYHQWTLRKLYRTSFKAMTPPRKDMLFRMGGFKKHDFGEEQERATLEDLNELVDVWRPILVQWRRLYEELDLEDTRRV